MGICCCRPKCSPHGPMDVMLPKPWGVGRLDHYNLEDDVRADVVRIVEEDLMGRQDQGSFKRVLHPLMEWVLGGELYDAERQRFCNNMARMIWEETVDYCGGIAMGMRDSRGQLGAVAFLVPIEPAMRSSIEASAWRCHLKYRLWYPWRKLGQARRGIQSRMRKFHDMRHKHFAPQDHVKFRSDMSLLAIRLLVGQGPEKESVQQKLLGVLCNYADQSGSLLVCHCIREESRQLFEDLGFETVREVKLQGDEEEDHHGNENEVDSRPTEKMKGLPTGVPRPPSLTLLAYDMYRKIESPPWQPDF